MPLLIATVGLPRSGKSTILRKLSAELHAPVVSRDAIRLALHARPYIPEAEPFTRAIYKVMIAALFEWGHEIVLADETHYSRAARNFVADGPWETSFLIVDTSPEVCIERAKATNQPWLLSVIPEMAARYEPLGPDEKTYIGYRSNPWPQEVKPQLSLPLKPPTPDAQSVDGGTGSSGL